MVKVKSVVVKNTQPLHISKDNSEVYTTIEFPEPRVYDATVPEYDLTPPHVFCLMIIILVGVWENKKRSFS